jgi:hypothetical protein
MRAFKTIDWLYLLESGGRAVRRMPKAAGEGDAKYVIFALHS